MSDRHEKAAALIRKYGTDADGVERAMREAGYSATNAHGMRDVFAAFLAKLGYDVTPLVAKAKPAPPIEVTADADAEKPARPRTRRSSKQ